MSKKSYLLVITLLLSSLLAKTQETDSALFYYFNSLGNDNSIASEYSIDELNEQIAQLKKHPIDLNKATRSDLEQLIFLTDFQITSLWNYLEKNRPLISIYELRAIPGFDIKDLKILNGLFICNPVVNSKPKFLESSYLLFQKYGNTQGDDTVSLYNSIADAKTFAKISSSYGDMLKCNVTAENDNAEKYTDKGFDFYSGHLMYQSKKIVKKFIVGDYSAHFGQGLVLWNGYSFNNSIDTRKRGRGVIPYAGVDENNFFRGTAASFVIGKLQTDVLFSSNKIDARTDSVTNVIRSFQQTGYHRSPTELKYRDAATMQTLAANLRINISRIRLGLTHVQHSFNSVLMPDDHYYQTFAMKGKSVSMTGFDFYFNTKKVDTYGEYALNDRLQHALITGSDIILSGNAAASVQYHSYHQGYYSFYNNGYSVSGGTTNETGLYTSLQLILDTSNTITASVDLYKHPWLKYGLFDMSKGAVFKILFDCKLVNGSRFQTALQYFSKPNNDTSELEILKRVEQIDGYSCKMSYQTQVGEKMTYSAKLLVSISDLVDDASVAMSQVMAFIPWKNFSCSVGYVMFDAEFQSRLGNYESDVRNGGFVQYFGSGDRLFVNLRFSVMKQLKINAKYASLYKIYKKEKQLSREISLGLSGTF